MAEHAWKEPVYIALGDHPGLVAICSTRRAAECLAYGWPDEDGDERRAALEACLGVLTGGDSPEVARQKFVAAAKDAGLLVTDPDKSASRH